MAAGAVLMAMGKATEAMGQISQANAAKAAADYNAAIGRENATMAIAEAGEKERQLRVSARKTIGAMRANYGASGVNIEGSPLDVLEESASVAELDALQIRHEGRSKARSYEAGARMDEFAGRNARTAGYLGAASTLLSGGASVSKMV